MPPTSPTMVSDRLTLQYPDSYAVRFDSSRLAKMEDAGMLTMWLANFATLLKYSAGYC